MGKLRNLMCVVVLLVLLVPSMIFAQDVTASSPVLALTVQDVIFGVIALVALGVSVVALVRRGANGSQSWQSVDSQIQQKLDEARERKEMIRLLESMADSLSPRVQRNIYDTIKLAQPIVARTSSSADDALLRLGDEVFDGVPLATKVKQLEAQLAGLAAQLPAASPPAAG